MTSSRHSEPSRSWAPSARLPAALDIVPILAPLAAVGLATIMVGAAIVTSRRHERAHAVLNVVYFAFALFVAIGRFGPESFS